MKVLAILIILCLLIIRVVIFILSKRIETLRLLADFRKKLYLDSLDKWNEKEEHYNRRISELILENMKLKMKLKDKEEEV